MVNLQALDAAWWNKYSWRCEPVDWSNSPEALRVAWAHYMYFLAKLTELLDTVNHLLACVPVFCFVGFA